MNNKLKYFMRINSLFDYSKIKLKSYSIMYCMVLLAVFSTADAASTSIAQHNKKITVGAYYFEGWSGQSLFFNPDTEPWAKNAPTHLTKRLIEEFPEREPIWGWRDDSKEIMERQIDLAADSGLSFFAFNWYRRDNIQVLKSQKQFDDPLNKGLELFLKAKNNTKLKFCLHVANHPGFEISGIEQWKQMVDIWIPYLKHKQYQWVDGKPLIIILVPSDANKDGLAYLQTAALKAGLPGVAVAGVDGGSKESGYSFRTHYNILPLESSMSEQRKYSEIVATGRRVWRGSAEQPYIPVVTSGWDKRPWEGPTGLNQTYGSYFPDRTPEQFAGFLINAAIWMDEHPGQTTAERIVLIYAWNEFGEGGYIAPTKGDPTGKFLKAIQSVVKPVNKSSQSVIPAQIDDKKQ